MRAIGRCLLAAVVVMTCLPAAPAAAVTQVISGTLVDQGTGAPIAGGRVTASRSDGTPGDVFTTTLADGSWSIQVEAGSYVLLGEDSRGRFIPEFYDDVFSKATATVVDASTGDQSGIVIDLVQVARITGKVTAAATGAPLVETLGDVTTCLFTFETINGNDVVFPNAGLECAADGTYTLWVTGGLYRLHVVPSSSGLLPEYENDVRVLADAFSRFANDGNVYTGVDFAVDGVPTVSGTVRYALSGDPVQGIEVGGACASPGGTPVLADFQPLAQRVTTLPDGTYTLPLPLGTCVVAFAPGSTDVQVAFMNGVATFEASLPFAFQAGPAGTITGIDGEVLFTGDTAAPPGPPTAVVGVPGANKVALSWKAPAWRGGSYLTDYVIQRSTDGGTTWFTVTDAVSTATSATISSLANGAAYRFRVAAVTAIGTGGYSTPSAVLVPRTKPNSPAAPTGTPGDRSVTLAWKAPLNGGSAITDYVVQYSSNNGLNWATFNDGVRSTTGAKVTGLVNGRPYVFRVKAKNAIGESAFGPKSAAVVPRTKPTAPKAPVPSARVKSVVLLWTAPTNGGSAITDYVVQFSSNNGVTWVTFADGVRAVTGANVTGLVTGRGYVFRVAARNAAGQGLFSVASSRVVVK